LLAAQSRGAVCIAVTTSFPAPAAELACRRGELCLGPRRSMVVAGGRVTSFWWAGLRSSP
jgi:hypothetical protein